MQDKRIKLSVLIACLAGILLLAVTVPDFFNYDIGYKNRQLKQTVTDGDIEDSLEHTEFTLPVIYIMSYDSSSLLNTSKSKIFKPTVADVYVLDRDINKITDIPTHIYINATMTLRGNSSAFHQEKKSFNLEFSDSEGKSLNLPFLNMEAESDFVFYAPYIDRSLIRNYLGYTLQALVQDWAPECRFVEVFLDTPDTQLSYKDYIGVYMVTEKFKRGANRINVGNFTVADTSERQFEQGGGYIYKMDWYDAEVDNVTRLDKNRFGNEYSIVYPKPQNITENDVKVIYDEIELYENALYNGSDEELEKYFDIEEIANNMLVSEFLKNHEAYSASTFFYRQPGGKIKAVQWDYDLGTGNMSFAGQEPSPHGFWVLDYWPYPQAFLRHENFREILISQWEKLRQGPLNENNIISILDDVETQLEGAWQRNDSAYPNMFINTPFAIWENGLESSQQERRFIKDYLIERGKWMDEHIYDLANQKQS